MKDTFHEIKVVSSLEPAVQAATLKGSAVDLRGFGSALMAVSTGAIASAGLYDIKIQESDTTTDGDFTDAAAADLLGVLPAGLAASSVYRQGYIGKRRYVRAVITKQSGTSIAAGAVFVLGHPALAPIA
ncbi:hypothetical protein RPMA_09595 [Tardiphaga alba]|uniref:Bacteriophage lambda head decoration protein D n=1 Tax=Tardiphaga alba TaxID=340268 RepID=A0ABX8A5Y8_9BRAD|nr:hypothetical protein [Tardiphaga alba]QUS39058.1 hypothetical protein RPMA_09595 [Tardiphaga alba]